MGLPAPINVEAWRQGRIRILEELIQGGPQEIAKSLAIFRQWAELRGLKPTRGTQRRRPGWTAKRRPSPYKRPFATGTRL
jgi:hypothetical protein